MYKYEGKIGHIKKKSSLIFWILNKRTMGYCTKTGDHMSQVGYIDFAIARCLQGYCLWLATTFDSRQQSNEYLTKMTTLSPKCWL